MNLECHVCTARKIATSFHSLDDLQAHLFMNHNDGPLDVCKFVCRKCEFKFGTEYRLLRHEEKCGRESRSEEDMEKIRYKFQMYELLEESLKYNMSKHHISGAQSADPSNVGTLETRDQSPKTQCQTESSGTKSIEFEEPESRENPISNSHQENSDKETTGASPSEITNESTDNLGNLRNVKAEVQDQNCSKNSATITQSNIKTEPEDVDMSEVEVLGSVEIRKRKAPSRSAESITHRSGISTQQNAKSGGESSNLRQIKRAKINLDESQIPPFTSIRDQEERMSTSTSTATGLRQTREEPSVKISGPVRMTNRIHVNGPCLHPEQVNKIAKQKEELRTYFSQFGEITSVTVTERITVSTLTFKNCDSAAKSMQQRTHKIRDQDFFVCTLQPSKCMRKRLKGNQNIPGPSTGNVSAANVQSDLAAESNLGSQMPQATASSLSQFKGSVREWIRSQTRKDTNSALGL